MPATRTCERVQDHEGLIADEELGRVESHQSHGPTGRGRPDVLGRLAGQFDELVLMRRDRGVS